MRKKIIYATVALIAAFSVVYFFFPGKMFTVLASLERKRAGVQLKVIDAGGWRTPYLEGGKGETVLLIHGFGGDKDNFTRFARYLTPKYHVLSPDLPGFGENERRPAENYSYSQQLTRVIAFIDALKVDRFHVAGNSMGGHLAGLLAARLGKRVISATLIDNAGFHEPVLSEREKLIKKGINALVADSTEDFDRLMGFIFFKKPFIPGPIKKYFAERALLNRAFNEKIFGEIGPERYLLESRFAEMTTPTLVIWGDTDRVIDKSATEVMKKIRPRITVEIMKDMGHSPMIERPEDTAKLMLDFIADKK
jgi:abhydrolase domain-containing protein 6